MGEPEVATPRLDRTAAIPNASWLTMLAVFAVYLVTAAPSILWYDTGELAIGAFTLGNGHPPGQPLYALLGRAMTLIPVSSIAFRLTVFSALCGVLSVLLLPGVLHRLGARMGARPSTPLASHLLLGGFGLALPLWLQAVRIELYSLHLLVMVVMLRLALDAGNPRRVGGLESRDASDGNTPDASHGSRPGGASDGLEPAGTTLAVEPGEDLAAGRPGRTADATRFLALAFLAGLALANHHLLVFLALPGLAVLAGWPGLVTLARAVAVAGLGLGVYLQAPLRSRAGALLDWGQPDHWSRWWEVVTGRAYQRTFTHLTLERFLSNLEVHAQLFDSLLGFPPLLLALAGFVRLARRAPRAAIGIGLLMAGNLASTVMQALYSAENPDSLGYMALTCALLGVLAALGLEGILQAWRQYSERATEGSSPLSRPAVQATLGGLVALLVAVVPAMRAWPRPDFHDNYLNHRFARLLMSTLPAGSIYLSSSDATTFAAWYQLTIEGARPDVATAGVYTLGAPNPLRRAYRPPTATPDTSRSPAAELARIIDLELPHRPVMMSANDMPLRREAAIRPGPMSLRVVAEGERPSALDPKVDLARDPVEDHWKRVTAELLADPAFLRDRQARLLFPAHLEALGDHYRALGLLEAAERMFDLARQLDPDPTRLMRLKQARAHALRSGGPETVPKWLPAELGALEQMIAQGRYPELVTAAADIPRTGPAYEYAAARWAWLRGDFSLVRSLLRAIRTQAPTGLEARAALLQMERLLPAAEAESWLRQVIPVQRDPELLAALGIRRLEAGAVEEAGRMLNAAVSADPEGVVTRTARAWYYIEVGSLWEAYADVQAASAREPVDPEVLKLTAHLYRNGIR